MATESGIILLLRKMVPLGIVLHPKHNILFQRGVTLGMEQNVDDTDFVVIGLLSRIHH